MALEAACRCSRSKRLSRFRPWVGKIPLEEETATHSSILAWRIPWTEGPGGLQSMGSQRVRHDQSDLSCTNWWPQSSNYHCSILFPQGSQEPRTPNILNTVQPTFMYLWEGKIENRTLTWFLHIDAAGWVCGAKMGIVRQCAHGGRHQIFELVISMCFLRSTLPNSTGDDHQLTAHRPPGEKVQLRICSGSVPTITSTSSFSKRPRDFFEASDVFDKFHYAWPSEKARYSIVCS